jgi:hypothetical protein
LEKRPFSALFCWYLLVVKHGPDEGAGVGEGVFGGVAQPL